MEELNSTVFVDRKEAMVNVPPPAQMNASKVNITPSEENESSSGENTEISAQVLLSQEQSSTVLTETRSSSTKPEEENQMSSLSAHNNDVHCPTATAMKLSEQQLFAREEMIQHSAESEVACSTTASEENSSTVEENQDQERAVQDILDEERLVLEATEARRLEEEKEVSEYCPGLAIRSLALEDILDKSTPSFSFTSESAASSLPSSDVGTSQIMSQSIASSTVYSAGPISSNSQNTPQRSSEPGAPPRKPFFDPIEVERKFTVEADTEDRLRALGAKLHKEKTFTDVYYDNDEYSLILSDCWLRRRNDSWEAKVPLKSQNTQLSPSTQYREISDEREISTWLVDQLGLESWMRGDPLELLVQAAGLTAFARFTTVRRSYTLPTCVVDLDLTDHGFRVGEIEVMAGSPEEVPQALQTISSVARQLGIGERDRTLGKMSLYLLRFKPWLYHRLVGTSSTSTPAVVT